MNAVSKSQYFSWPLVASFACGVFGTVMLYQLRSRLNTPRAIETADHKIVLTRVNDASLGDRFIGTWIVDRTDTPEDEREFVAFDSNGTYSDDATNAFGQQWFCTGGLIYLVSRAKGVAHGKSCIVPLVPVFNDSGSVVTLSPPGGAPRLTMTKLSNTCG